MSTNIKITEYNYEADKQFTQYLEMCKKDILENLPLSEGGIYIGSDSNGVVTIGYGKTEIIRKGFKAIITHPVLKQILLEELEAAKPVIAEEPIVILEEVKIESDVLKRIEKEKQNQ